MTFPLLSFGEEFLCAGLDCVEPNLACEHQNVYFENLFCPVKGL